MSETVDIHGIPGIIMHWLPKNNCFYQKMMFVMIRYDQYFSSQKIGHRHLVSYPLAPENIVAEAEGSLGLKCGPRCVELYSISWFRTPRIIISNHIR